MSAQLDDKIRRTSAPEIAARKGREPIVCLTAYTTPMAEILDEHCDLLLVGDSVGMVMHGLPNTVGVTMGDDDPARPGGDARRPAGHGGDRHALRLLRGDVQLAYANAVRILKETGAQGVKVESGPDIPETIAYMVRRGIPVMGHVGLRPQSALVDGAFKAKGRSNLERSQVLDEAKAASEAGAFCVVVEAVAESLARDITAAIEAPTSGSAARPPATARS